jgi:hypothetical protein
VSFDLSNEADVKKYKEQQLLRKTSVIKSSAVGPLGGSVKNEKLFQKEVKGNWKPSKWTSNHWSYPSSLDIDPLDITVESMSIDNLPEAVRATDLLADVPDPRYKVATLLTESEEAYLLSLKHLFQCYVGQLIRESYDESAGLVTSSLSQFFVTFEQLVALHDDLSQSLKLELHKLEDDSKSLGFCQCFQKISLAMKLYIDYVRFRVRAMKDTELDAFVDYLRMKRFRDEHAPEFGLIFQLPVKRIQQYLPLVSEYHRFSEPAERKLCEAVEMELKDSLLELSRMSELSVLESRFSDFGNRLNLTSGEWKLILKSEFVVVGKLFSQKHVFFIFNGMILQTWAYQIIRRFENLENIKLTGDRESEEKAHRITLQLSADETDLLVLQAKGGAHRKQALSALKESGVSNIK